VFVCVLVSYSLGRKEVSIGKHGGKKGQKKQKLKVPTVYHNDLVVVPFFIYLLHEPRRAV
jgi:hypothetical protein